VYSFLPSIIFPRGLLSRGFFIEKGFNEAPHSMKSCLSAKFSSKSLMQVPKNLLAKEEFTKVRPCRECDKKPLGQESFKENLSAKEEFTQVNPCREYDKKPLSQESFKENLSAKEEFTQANPCRECDKKPLGQGRIHPSESLPRVR